MSKAKEILSKASSQSNESMPGLRVLSSIANASTKVTEASKILNGQVLQAGVKDVDPGILKDVKAIAKKLKALEGQVEDLHQEFGQALR